MSGTFPATPAPRRIAFASLTQTNVSMSHSMKRYTRTMNAQRWALSLDFKEATRENFAAIWAFLVKQRGQYDTFQYVLPRPLYNPRGSLGGSPVVNNSAGSPTELQTGRALNIKGLSNSITNWGRAGDFFKLAGHSKVYMLTADVNSDGSGLATLNFDPALVESPAENEALTFTNVPFTVSLTDDKVAFQLMLASILHQQTVDLIEAY